MRVSHAKCVRLGMSAMLTDVDFSILGGMLSYPEELDMFRPANSFKMASSVQRRQL